jgi:putative transposase
MKRVAEALGVSRSNLAERGRGRSQSRGRYVKADDEALLPLIRRFADERPTYGYRRIAVLVNRELARQGLPLANRKRVHRIMHRHSLLLERCTGRREGRVHDGKVMVMRSNLRWCSDGLEFTCWNGEIVRKTFKRDYVRVNPLPDAATALRQIAGCIADYNDVHPHSALRMRSPREFIRAQAQ